jgi:DNA-binding transcriptional MerR regulator
MTASGPRKPPILGTTLFIAIAIGAAVASVLVGRYLYDLAAKPAVDFYAKLGELALQLAVVVIVGALVKVVVDWGASQRARYLEKVEARKEFMRRVRAMHVTIQNARDLMNAHQSAKTWGEQSRRLMELRPEVEEICEDLKASDRLFTRQSEIVEGLEAIISYLARAGEEYVRSHGAVGSGHKAGQSLPGTFDEIGMTWVRDFMAGGEDYQKNYEASLTKSKGAMRTEVYGVSAIRI